MPFVKRLNPRYLDGWVHRDICERLERFSQDVVDGKSPRLMLLMPPRHGKSELASKNFPAWHLGRNPDHEFISCSYNLDLALDFSRKVQGIIDDEAYQSVFGTKLDPNNRSASSWALSGSRGAYLPAGIGGPITGKGAHILVIDDPVKNAEEADSADAREKIWQWYLSTAYSRLAPGGGVLVIQTWWHDDDLAGRLQQMMKVDADDPDREHIDQFEVVKYPAIAEQDEYVDPLTHQIIVDTSAHDLADLRLLRSKGEALHPARYDLNKLLRIKAQHKGGRWWSALYQQNPVPDDGGYFLKEQFRRGPPPHYKRCNVFIAWDFAISEKKTNDYTVGTVALQDENDLMHVVEVVRFKSGNAFFIVDAILSLCEKWYSPALRLGFEDGQIWRSLEALFTKTMRERERKLYPSITLLKPLTDKLTRGRALQGRMQQGMVSFAEGAEWYETVRNEMLRFPAGVHDDCVDSLAWVTQMVVESAAPVPPKPQGMKSWKDRLQAGVTHGVSHMAA